MARRPDLEKFAAEHQLKIGTIADLIKYRVENERTVERVAEATLPTTYGDFRLIAYKDSLGDPIHFALVKGEILRDEPVLVRVHLEDAIADTLPVDSTAFGWPLYDAMKRISEAGAGVAVVLRQHESNQTLVQRIQRLGGVDPHAHKQWSGEAEDLRTYGIGAQILADVGVRKMRLLSTPKKMHGLSGFGLEVTDYIWEDV
jgi:3,4-dihydroxy 2-butanone 4-phosphate synthase/GTP cyclohydrolase II